MQTIDVTAGDGVLRTRVVGSGPVLVFVHGALVDGRLWDSVVSRLSSRFTCVVPDLQLGSHTLPLPTGKRTTAFANQRVHSHWHLLDVFLKTSHPRRLPRIIYGHG